MPKAPRKWPRFAWRASEIPTVFTPDVRRRLIAANKGFDVAPRLDELEEPILDALAHERLESPASERHAELARLAQLAKDTRDAIALLHPRSQFELGHGPLPRFDHDLKRFRRTLSDLRRACVAVDRRLRSGRPAELRRDHLIARVCDFVDSLEPTRARATVLAKLSKGGGRDHVVSLQQDDLQRRRAESVKILCAAVGRPVEGDVSRIIAKVLSKEPT